MRSETAPGRRHPPSGILSWTIFLLGLIFAVATGLREAAAPGRDPAFEVLSQALPEGLSFQKKGDPVEHFLGLGPSGEVVGAVVMTASVPPEVSGYMGEIDAAVGVSQSGRIRGVVLGSHSETPYYMGMVLSAGLLQAFSDLDLSRPFPALDSVTGATVSSQALIRDIRSAATLAAEKIFSLEVPPPAAPDANPWKNWRVWVLAAALALGMAASFGPSVRALHTASLVAGLALVGVVLNCPVTLSALARILSLNLPGLGNPLLILTLLYILASLPLFGRGYCRHVCPFGALQELLNRYWPWQIYPQQKMAAFLPHFRRSLLGILLLLAFVPGWAGFTEVEPFFGLFSFDLSPLAWIFVIIIIMISLFWRRFWCNGLCPTGTLLAAASRLARPAGRFDDETV